MHGIIFGAGFGTRMRPYTEVLPKPAIPFLNIPHWAHSLFFLEQLQCDNIFINTHYLPERMKESVNTINTSRPIHLVHEPNEILGSSGGLANILISIKSPSEHVAVFNGDTIRLFKDPKKLNLAFEKHVQEDALLTFVLMPHPDASRSLSAVWIGKNNEFRDVGLTCADHQLRPYHYPGIFFANKKIAQYIEPKYGSLFTDVCLPLSKKGLTIKSVVIEDMYFGETGNITDYLQTTEFCIDQLARKGVFAKNLQDILSRFTPQWRFISNSEWIEGSSGYALLNGEISLQSRPQSIEGFFIANNGVTLDTSKKISNLVINSDIYLDHQKNSTNDLIL